MDVVGGPEGRDSTHCLGPVCLRLGLMALQQAEDEVDRIASICASCSNPRDRPEGEREERWCTDGHSQTSTPAFADAIPLLMRMPRNPARPRQVRPPDPPPPHTHTTTIHTHHHHTHTHTGLTAGYICQTRVPTRAMSGVGKTLPSISRGACVSLHAAWCPTMCV